MKKIASALLLLVFLFNIMGYYAVFELMRIRIGSEMNERIRKGHEKTILLVIRLDAPSSEFQWIEKDEFRYRGMMYDASSIDIRGNKMYAWCVQDNKEQSLYSWMKNMQSSQKEYLQSLYQHIIHIAITEKAVLADIFPSVHTVIFNPHHSSVLPGEKVPLQHPPEMILS